MIGKKLVVVYGRKTTESLADYDCYVFEICAVIFSNLLKVV